MLEIWADNPIEANWFMDLNIKLKKSSFHTIGARETNSSVEVNKLIKYDRPDIILLKEKKPILVLEKTREVPTGHNVGQRFARLVRSAEMQIPVIYFLPFDARKHGKYSSICNLNARLIRAMLNLSEIHKTPCLTVNWPSDDDGQLVIDGTEDKLVRKLVTALIEKDGFKSKVISSHLTWMANEYEERCQRYPGYRGLPTSVEITKTDQFILKNPQITETNRKKLRRRSDSMVYKIDMSEGSCKRQDPYTGMQFIYDYAWLRSGPTPKNRNKNLILQVPNVRVSTWKSKNPNDSNTKSCNWYLTADAIVLKDGMIPIEH